MTDQFQGPSSERLQGEYALRAYQRATVVPLAMLLGYEPAELGLFTPADIESAHWYVFRYGSSSDFLLRTLMAEALEWIELGRELGAYPSDVTDWPKLGGEPWQTELGVNAAFLVEARLGMPANFPDFHFAALSAWTDLTPERLAFLDAVLFESESEFDDRFPADVEQVLSDLPRASYLYATARNLESKFVYPLHAGRDIGIEPCHMPSDWRTLEALRLVEPARSRITRLEEFDDVVASVFNMLPSRGNQRR